MRNQGTFLDGKNELIVLGERMLDQGRYELDIYLLISN